ncbi:trehalose-6-phosphate synthase [Roseomonas sp. OT10]|uniref:alpha,alpha-trehalose-phosphate synthase (UDP-forming) n=1 Tax=Roseomonas cutis TaxID=2897332 RepID=UPI001E5AF9FA|nr:trehalose-6-phosphate synthase [Roseomonas sp. OT10]UFN50263.1 trehalose-6-phosphate synthase [Roseomonas sp. OT10]
MGRLVIVSNRVAVPKRQEAPAAGGLAVALKDVFEDRSGLWFGWSGQVVPEVAEGVKTARRGNVDYAVFDLSEDAYRGFYVGHANGVLWPLFHFRLGLLSYDRWQAEAYREVNRDFARRLMPLLRPDDTIWVHDYQLTPLGAALRELGSTHRIGYFHHIPFPPYAVFSALPGADALLTDLLAYDLVGVQSHRDLQGLIDCMNHGTGMQMAWEGEVRLRGRTTRLQAHPIGIATQDFAETAARAVREPATRRLVSSLGGRSLAIGAERLDYTKGLPERLLAFRALLKDYPEHLNRVTYLQVAARSRNDIESYRDLRRDLDRLAGTINGDYAEPDWTPVRYVARTVAREHLAGFYRVSKLGLVTPLRDGMNLVAKEYVAAQDPEDPGVLVLSRFAGAAEGMPEALLVNPLDAEGVAQAMHEGLRMPRDERRDRHGAMYRRLAAANVGQWARNFLQVLEEGEPPSQPSPEAAERRARTSSSSAPGGSSVSHRAGSRKAVAS